MNRFIQRVAIFNPDKKNEAAISAKSNRRYKQRPHFKTEQIACDLLQHTKLVTGKEENLFCWFAPSTGVEKVLFLKVIERNVTSYPLRTVAGVIPDIAVCYRARHGRTRHVYRRASLERC